MQVACREDLLPEHLGIRLPLLPLQQKGASSDLPCSGQRATIMAVPSLGGNTSCPLHVKKGKQLSWTRGLSCSVLHGDVSPTCCCLAAVTCPRRSCGGAGCSRS